MNIYSWSALDSLSNGIHSTKQIIRTHFIRKSAQIALLWTDQAYLHWLIIYKSHSFFWSPHVKSAHWSQFKQWKKKHAVVFLFVYLFYFNVNFLLFINRKMYVFLYFALKLLFLICNNVLTELQIHWYHCIEIFSK